MIRYGGASLPGDASRRQFAGVCLLCGVGFTMSFFIGNLAFEGRGAAYGTQLKLGVLCGSLIAALCGVVLLWKKAR